MDDMTVESFTNTLIKNYKSVSDEFFHIYDYLAHVELEHPSDALTHVMGIAWSNHAALENLIAKLEGKPNVY
jgi:hypothetical protein